MTQLTSLAPVSGAKAATFYNHYLGCYIIKALYELGIFAALENRKSIAIDSILTKKESKQNLYKLLDSARLLGIIKLSANKMSLTSVGIDIHQNIGFFIWIIGGYSKLLDKTADLIPKEFPSLAGLIDGEKVALGSFECGKRLMQPTLAKVIEGLDYNSIADLGCGNAGRLISFVRAKQNSKGIGVDISLDAVNLARKNISTEGLEKRIKIYCENVFDSLKNEQTQFPEVDVVTSFMMFHDLLNMDEIRDDIFTYLERTFPNAKYYLIADTTLGQNYDEQDLPIFSLGFELIHSLMEVQLFPLSYYINFFKSSNLKIEKLMPFGAPNTYIFLLSKLQ